MGKPIDQERDPFASKLNSITETLLETANAGLTNALGQIETLRAENARLVEELEQARASVQPAGGAVPEADIERMQWEASYYRSTLRNVLKDIRDDLVRGGLPDSWRGVAETISITLECATQASDKAMVEMVDAAMLEMKSISPALRRSECERLITAALGYLRSPKGERT
nr:hypothetical protein [uncultured Pseudomonas sp.]